jgi:hypothetical protein
MPFIVLWHCVELMSFLNVQGINIAIPIIASDGCWFLLVAAQPLNFSCLLACNSQCAVAAVKKLKQSRQ